MGRWALVPRRTRLLVAAAGAVVVVALIVATLLANRVGDHVGASSATTGEAAPTTPPAAVSAVPTPTPAGPTDVVDDPPPGRAAVALDETSAVGDGVTGSVVRVTAIDASADGPGNVDGPGVAVVVRISNGTTGPIQLDGVQVNLTYSTAQLAGSPIDDARVAPTAGALAAGGSAEGTYVYSVPADQRSTITITVGYQAGAPLMVFSGPAD